MLTKRKVNTVDRGRHGLNEDIVVFWELEFNGDLMVPGTMFKVKNDKSIYKFDCFAHNVKLDVTWVNARCVETGQFRSFRVDKIRNIIKAKVSRAKKK